MTATPRTTAFRHYCVIVEAAINGCPDGNVSPTGGIVLPSNSVKTSGGRNDRDTDRTRFDPTEGGRENEINPYRAYLSGLRPSRQVVITREEHDRGGHFVQNEGERDGEDYSRMSDRFSRGSSAKERIARPL